MASPVVTIVYPIDGEKYPKAFPSGDCKCESFYVTASFSVMDSGGPIKIEWGFDKDNLGSCAAYDQMSGQFVWKLPQGTHTFWVTADNGGRKSQQEVKFTVC